MFHWNERQFIIEKQHLRDWYHRRSIVDSRPKDLSITYRDDCSKSDWRIVMIGQWGVHRVSVNNSYKLFKSVGKSVELSSITIQSASRRNIDLFSQTAGLYAYCHTECRAFSYVLSQRVFSISTTDYGRSQRSICRKTASSLVSSNLCV